MASIPGERGSRAGGKGRLLFGALHRNELPVWQRGWDAGAVLRTEQQGSWGQSRQRNRLGGKERALEGFTGGLAPPFPTTCPPPLGAHSIALHCAQHASPPLTTTLTTTLPTGSPYFSMKCIAISPKLLPPTTTFAPLSAHREQVRRE